MLGKERLLLIQVHGDDAEINWRPLLQVEQDIQHGVGVFAATEAGQYGVALFDHIEITNGLADLPFQAFFQAIEVGRCSLGHFFRLLHCLSRFVIRLGALPFSRLCPRSLSDLG